MCYGRLHFADPFFVDPRTFVWWFFEDKKKPADLVVRGFSFSNFTRYCDVTKRTRPMGGATTKTG